jgi:hypothetical protein
VSAAKHIRRDWRSEARCIDADPNLFDAPEQGEQGEALRTRLLEAVTFCARCPVAAECLDDARIHGDVGVRGGILYARTNLSDAKPAERVAPELKPCGTLAAYRRHQRNGEKACGPCSLVKRLDVAERRARRAA